MWRLPTDLLPPLEQALAEAEATLREAIGKREERSWHKIQMAISKTMASSFDAFCVQACLAVKQSQLTVFEARSGAEEFLENRANALHEWLIPVMDRYVPGCPYSFRRYNSNDRFIFVRDMVEGVQSSEEWVRFLRDLAANNGRKQPDAEQAIELSEQLKTEASRRAFVAPLLDTKGWSILDWALDAGVDPNTAADYLSGTTTPHRHTRKKLATALGVAVEQFPK